MKFVALATLLLLCGCLGTTPEDREIDALGDEPSGHPGPTHRPGQPCLLCHDGEFELAGTIFERLGDERGTEGVEVEISDDAGHVFHTTTNRAGNFYVRLDESRTAPSSGREGRVSIPWQLSFPLEVVIRRGDIEEEMRSRIYRERSCAGCHAPDKSATSPGAIVLVNEDP